MDLSHIKYTIKNGTDITHRGRLSVALGGRICRPPTQHQWYHFSTFCRVNGIENGNKLPEKKLIIPLSATFMGTLFTISNSESWSYMLSELGKMLRPLIALPRSSHKRLPILEFQFLPSQSLVSGPQTSFGISSNTSWVAYTQKLSKVTAGGDVSLNDEADDDEWSACCDFMNHSYNAREEGEGKQLLGTALVLSSAEMLDTHRFLCRVAAGESGMVAKTIGSPGTLRVQLAIVAILRLIFLNSQHYKKNKEQHRPSRDNGSTFTEALECAALDPFGIQCVCRPLSLSSRLAEVVGEKALPFMFLLRTSVVGLCFNAVLQYFPPGRNNLLPSSDSALVKPLLCGNMNKKPPPGTSPVTDMLVRYVISGEEEQATRHSDEQSDRGGFLVLFGVSELAGIFSGRETTVARDWLFKKCQFLHICYFDIPLWSRDDLDPHIMRFILWKLELPGSPRLPTLSITTPDDLVAYLKQQKWKDMEDRRYRYLLGLLNAIGPGCEQVGNRIITLGEEMPPSARALLFHRYGFTEPYISDITFLPKPSREPGLQDKGLPKNTDGAMRVIVEYRLYTEQSGPSDTKEQALKASDIRKISSEVGKAINSSNAHTFELSTARGMASKYNKQELLPSLVAYEAATESGTHDYDRENDRNKARSVVLGKCASLQELRRIIEEAGPASGSIFVLVNDPLLEQDIICWANDQLCDIARVFNLIPKWTSSVYETDNLEAQIRAQATAAVDKVAVIFASPEAIVSCWLSLSYVGLCVVFGAPFSRFALNAMIQSICYDRKARDIKIIHIGLSDENTLNRFLRVINMEST